MGSYNVSCGLTGIPVTSNCRVGIQLLYPSGKETTGVHIGSNALYHSVGLPIYGTYDSYGRIENIESSNATRFIEKAFKKPVEEIIKIVSNGRFLYDNSDLCEAYCAPENLLNSYKSSTEDVLLSLGFVLSKKTNEATILEFSTTKEVNPRVIVINNQIQGVLLGDSMTPIREYGLHSQLNAFNQLSRLFPGVSPENQVAVEMLSQMKMMFFLPEPVEVLSAIIKDDYERDESSYYSSYFKEHLDAFRELVKKMDSEGGEQFTLMSQALHELSTIVGRNTVVDCSFFNSFMELSDNEIRSFNDLSLVFDHVNRIFMPSIYVSEDHNPQYHLALNEVSRQILEGR